MRVDTLIPGTAVVFLSVLPVKTQEPTFVTEVESKEIGRIASGAEEGRIG